MEVDTTAESTNYQGKRYYFCSSECRLEFEEDPESYLEAAIPEEAEKKERPGA
jgi:YHS domain-containing protein